jgi:hypothetical protein
LPDIHDGAGDRAVIGGWNLEHHRPHVFRVDERRQVDRIGVRSQSLDLPVRKARPVGDLIEAALVARQCLVHELEVDGWHAPVDGLDGAALHRASSQLVGGELGWMFENRGCWHEVTSFAKTVVRHSSDAVAPAGPMAAT